MHINEIVQLLSDHNGTLTGKKGKDGLVYVTVLFPGVEDVDGYIEVAGFDIDSVMKSAKKRIDRRLKSVGHIRITSGGGKRA